MASASASPPSPPPAGPASTRNGTAGRHVRDAEGREHRALGIGALVEELDPLLRRNEVEADVLLRHRRAAGDPEVPLDDNLLPRLATGLEEVEPVPEAPGRLSQRQEHSGKQDPAKRACHLSSRPARRACHQSAAASATTISPTVPSTIAPPRPPWPSRLRDGPRARRSVARAPRARSRSGR